MPDQSVDRDAQNAGRSYVASHLSTFGRARRLLPRARSGLTGFGSRTRRPPPVRAGGAVLS